MTSGRSGKNHNKNNSMSNSMATSGVSVGQEVVIYEDHFYKLRTISGLRTFSINYKPWRLKYFILKKKDENLMLEYYDRQPILKKNPKMQLLLHKYCVEKITNSKNRAYVFEINTPERRLCLSANEQRTMDMFVFFLQIQRKLIRELTEDYIVVQPENSETLRRIGARGCPCLLYISPYGVTLALQSSLRVLAQWPLKSIRCYESSCQGQFSLEAGRVAPMGDGLYIFNTQPGDDDRLYDLLDKHVVNALPKIRPGQQIAHQIEEYAIENKQLQSLTQFSICTQHQEEIPRILQENWNLILPSFDNSRRTSSSITVPTRAPITRPDFLANFSSSSQLPPPLPIRSMNTTSTEVLTASPEAFAPDFRSLQLKSPNGKVPHEGRPLDNSNQSVPDFVSNGHTAYMNPTGKQVLRHSLSLSGPEQDSLLNVFESSPENNEGYLTACLKKNNNVVSDKGQTGNSESNNLNKSENSLRRRSRLKSRSCEDMNSYIKMSALKDSSNPATTADCKTEPKEDNVENRYINPPVPFPRLQNLRSSLYCDSNGLNNFRVASVYYGNITRKKNGVYEPANPGVSELRQIFDGDEKKMRKSVSNPNFFNISSKDNSVCPMAFAPEPSPLGSGNKNKSTHKSWRNLFTERRRRSNHDNQQNNNNNHKNNNNNNNNTPTATTPTNSSSAAGGAAENGPSQNENAVTRLPGNKGRSSSFSKKSSQSYQTTSSQVTDTYKGVRMTPKTRSYRRLKSESSALYANNNKSPLKEATPPLASVESLC